MPRDFWQTFKKALRVNKLNKYITLPAFSRMASNIHCCIAADPSMITNGSAPVTISDGSPFAFQCWFKVMPPSSSAAKYLFDFEDTSGNNVILLSIQGSDLIFRSTTLADGLTSTTVANTFKYNEWCHVTIICVS